MSTLRSPTHKSSSCTNLIAKEIKATSEDCVNTIPRKRKFVDMDSMFMDALKSFKEEIIGSVNELRTVITAQDDKISKLNENINACVKEEIHKLTVCFEELKLSVEHTDIELKNTNQRISVLEKRVTHTESLESKVIQMQDTISQLKCDIGKQQQQARQLNIELVGLPENPKENLIAVVLRLSELMGVPLVAENIDYATRVQSMNPVKGRPRNIIVKMRMRIHKDNLISGARKHRISSDMLGYAGESVRIYINEHLTRENKQLFRLCRARAADLNYKYVWIKNCYIYVRKNDTSPFLLINSEVELLKKII